MEQDVERTVLQRVATRLSGGDLEQVRARLEIAEDTLRAIGRAIIHADIKARNDGEHSSLVSELFAAADTASAWEAQVEDAID